MAGKTIVILGGGAGGSSPPRTAQEVGEGTQDRPGGQADAPRLCSLLHLGHAGMADPPQIIRDLSLLRKKGIEYVNAEALEIDLGNRLVKTGAGDFAYDYLIVALGAELNPQAVPGLSEAAHTPYSLEGSVALGTL